MLSYGDTTVKAVEGEDKQERLQNWAAATHAIKLEAAAGGNGLPGWTTVFGPAVWTDSGSDDADNTWLISHNPKAQFDDGVHDTYVLAIAGTVTTYDWLSEDMSVTGVVDFVKWMADGINSQYSTEWKWWIDDQDKAYISAGTAQGMSVILDTKAPSGTAPPGVGKTIVEFIAALPSTCRLVITGHSLGSALSSGIACALKQCGYLDRFEKTLVFGIAGPSPGNGKFAEYFAQSFPMTPKPTSGPVYKVWNSNLWNTYDIVPHAWSVTDPERQLSKIEDIWPMDFFAEAFVDGAVKIAEGWVYLSFIDYVPVQGTSFTGAAPSINPAKSKDDIVANAKQEHTAAYYALLAIPPPKAEVSLGWKLDKFGLRLKTDEEIVESEPFLELLRHTSDEKAKAGFVRIPKVRRL